MNALRTAAGELAAALDAVGDAEFAAFVRAFPATGGQGRIFFAGQGRSGLCAAMAAMRFMHLGYDAHLAGEATAPSVRSGDALVIVSGSGRGGVGIANVTAARLAGASVMVLSNETASPLGSLADHSFVLGVGPAGAQFGGTLFEQSALIVLDAVVLALMPGLADAPATMAANHTNLGA